MSETIARAVDELSIPTLPAMAALGCALDAVAGQREPIAVGVRS